MLNEQRVSEILEKFKSMDLEIKLKAINQATLLFAEAFTDNLSPEEYAYTARVIETYYNLVRDALKSGEQIRIAPPALGAVATPRPKKAKAATGTKKKKAAEIGFDTMAAMFKEFAAKSGVNPNVPTSTGSSDKA